MSPTTVAIFLSLSLIVSVHQATALKVAQTFYGFPDNDPSGPRIVLDCGRGNEAGGIGTYDDPLTFATAPGPFEECETIYDPSLLKYLRYEDFCQTCDADWQSGKWHIDVWVGAKDFNGEGDQIACENKLTSPPQKHIVRDPDPDLPVDTTPLYIPGRFCKADQAGYFLSSYEYNDQDFTKQGGAAKKIHAGQGQPKPEPPVQYVPAGPVQYSPIQDIPVPIPQVQNSANQDAPVNTVSAPPGPPALAAPAAPVAPSAAPAPPADPPFKNAPVQSIPAPGVSTKDVPINAGPAQNSTDQASNEEDHVREYNDEEYHDEEDGDEEYGEKAYSEDYEGEDYSHESQEYEGEYYNENYGNYDGDYETEESRDYEDYDYQGSFLF
ncbi:hypothetical protein BDV59DRAFT_182606 [Aspergillus ambiguus]|uniref:uncharacterized protein n=1 Tax=Aspergillus ambiguus TaxID=176160 RepID=UPI003CCDC1F8